MTRCVFSGRSLGGPGAHLEPGQLERGDTKPWATGRPMPSVQTCCGQPPGGRPAGKPPARGGRLRAPRSPPDQREQREAQPWGKARAGETPDSESRSIPVLAGHFPWPGAVPAARERDGEQGQGALLQEAHHLRCSVRFFSHVFLSDLKLWLYV